MFSKYLVLALGVSIVLNLLGASLAVHEYRQVGVEKEACNTRVTAVLAKESAAAYTDQHTADQASMASLEREIVNLQSDASAAAGRRARLNAQLHDQQEVLHHVLASAKAGDCLHQRVPAALVGSLYAGAEHSAQPPG